MASTGNTKLWRTRASALRKLNVGLETDYKDSKSLARLKRQWAEWKDVATFPERYRKIDISKYRKEEQQSLAREGYQVKAGKVFVSLDHYENASIARDTYKTERGPYDRLVINRTIHRDGKVFKKQTEYIGTRLQRLDWRDRLLEEYNAGKFKQGERLMVKVYDQGPMMGSQATSLALIFKYIDQIEWVTPGNHEDHIHLVKVWSAGTETRLLPTEAERSRQKRKDIKRRTKLGVKKRKSGGK